jgi:hypothetical protein
MSEKEYIDWFHSYHPKPVDIRQATRFWLDRFEMLWRKQHPAPGSYKEFLQRNLVGPRKNYEDEDGYDYISHTEDTWDKRSLYRMHTIRQQAAIDLQHSAGIVLVHGRIHVALFDIPPPILIEISDPYGGLSILNRGVLIIVRVEPVNTLLVDMIKTSATGALLLI